MLKSIFAKDIWEDKPQIDVIIPVFVLCYALQMYVGKSLSKKTLEGDRLTTNPHFLE